MDNRHNQDNGDNKNNKDRNDNGDNRDNSDNKLFTNVFRVKCIFNKGFYADSKPSCS